MALTSANLSYLLTEAVSSVAINEFMTYPQLLPMLSSVQPSPPTDRITKASVGSIGTFQEKTPGAAAQQGEVTQQFLKQWINKAYALELTVHREFIDDNKFGYFSDLGMQLGEEGARKIEEDGATPYNDAFDGSTHTAEDGLSLCNDAHVNVDGGNSQDNYGTNALDSDGLTASKEAMASFTNYEGKVINCIGDLLLVPYTLEAEAKALAMSQQEPFVTNNTVNVHQGTRFVVWKYLTDTNAWFLLDSRSLMKNMPFYIRTALEFYGSMDQSTQTRKIGGYMRYTNGPRDWRFVYGNNPS